MKNKKIKQNKGQIAIMVLLVSAVILTLGLSASKKAVTDTKVDTDEQLLKEAFNAAESGINNYINDGSSSYEAGNGAKASVNSTAIGGDKSLTSEGLVTANNNQLFWLVNHENNGDIGATYYSGNINFSPVGNFTGVLKVDYFYINASNKYQVDHLICDYNSSGLVPNSFSNCLTLVTTGKKSLLVNITPLGAPIQISLSGASNFPNQGEELTAVGTAGDGVKTQIRTRNIYQVPSFMIEAITAGNIIQ